MNEDAKRAPVCARYSVDDDDGDDDGDDGDNDQVMCLTKHIVGSVAIGPTM
jgi:hypothetical protein